MLVSLGKPIADLVEPKLLALKLLRGFIEHFEIIGGLKWNFRISEGTLRKCGAALTKM